MVYVNSLELSRRTRGFEFEGRVRKFKDLKVFLIILTRCGYGFVVLVMPKSAQSRISQIRWGGDICEQVTPIAYDCLVVCWTKESCCRKWRPAIIFSLKRGREGIFLTHLSMKWRPSIIYSLKRGWEGIFLPYLNRNPLSVEDTRRFSIGFRHYRKRWRRLRLLDVPSWIFPVKKGRQKMSKDHENGKFHHRYL